MEGRFFGWKWIHSSFLMFIYKFESHFKNRCAKKKIWNRRIKKKSLSEMDHLTVLKWLWPWHTPCAASKSTVGLQKACWMPWSNSETSISIGYGPFSNSDHQDSFLVGNPYKPLFATVTGKGPHPTYLSFQDLPSHVASSKKTPVYRNHTNSYRPIVLSSYRVLLHFLVDLNRNLPGTSC